MNLPAKVVGLDNLRFPDNRQLHLAIGMFDGVHLGHQSVIRGAIEAAGKSGGIAAVLTFWPHPSALFTPDRTVPQITTPEVKEEILSSLGVQLVIEQPFTPEFAAIPAEEFVQHLRRCLPRLASIHIGENWRFGKGRKGDADLLVALGRAHGVEVVSAPRLQVEGEPISSTRIRDCLARGQITFANTLLGHTYFSEGTVKEGQRVGRTLGFPTLNLAWDPQLKPLFGVYLVRVARSDAEKEEERLPGVANYGIRPTVDASMLSAPLLEIHLLENVRSFATGDRLRVEWLEFLRPEKRFASLDELKEQIERDVTKARELFRSKRQGT